MELQNANAKSMGQGTVSSLPMSPSLSISNPENWMTVACQKAVGNVRVKNVRSIDSMHRFVAGMARYQVRASVDPRLLESCEKPMSNQHRDKR
ncbi:hypothetical protein SCLCIDRAFT_1210871 [Scleroderma citrinum Foug A]|uniref:Uncharacterized protein n=1 Tax=Scleroderma citrinum Foug A TaxID=1036808 RepID=A0A0C3E1Z1_9AGAM|nr:hypothetical protein SCLCIDRAFT_1210871 [Scleroderma citrinum Foug A]